MRTVLHDQVVVLGCFYHLVQFYYVLVSQVLVDFYLWLQHVQTVTFEFLQIDHLYRVSFVLLYYLYSFVNVGGKASAELVFGIVLVLSHFDFGLLECKAEGFLPCQRPRDAALAMEGS